MNKFYKINENTGLFEPSFTSEMLEDVLKRINDAYPGSLEDLGSIPYKILELIAGITSDSENLKELYEIAYQILYGIYSEIFSLQDLVEYANIGDLTFLTLKNFLKDFDSEKMFPYKRDLVLKYLKSLDLISEKRYFRFVNSSNINDIWNTNNSYFLENGKVYKNEEERSYFQVEEKLVGNFYAHYGFEKVNAGRTIEKYFVTDSSLGYIPATINDVDRVLYIKNEDGTYSDANETLYGTYYILKGNVYNEVFLPLEYTPETLYYELIENNNEYYPVKLPAQYIPGNNYYTKSGENYINVNKYLPDGIYFVEDAENGIFIERPISENAKAEDGFTYFQRTFKEVKDIQIFSEGMFPDISKLESDMVFQVSSNIINRHFAIGTQDSENNVTWISGSSFSDNFLTSDKSSALSFINAEDFMKTLIYTGRTLKASNNGIYAYSKNLDIVYKVYDINSISEITFNYGNLYAEISKILASEDSPFLDDYFSKDILNESEIKVSLKPVIDYFGRIDSFRNIRKAEEEYYSKLEKFKYSNGTLKDNFLLENFKSESGYLLSEKLFKDNFIHVADSIPNRNLSTYRTFPEPAFLDKPSQKELYLSDRNYNSLAELIFSRFSYYTTTLTSGALIVKFVNELTELLIELGYGISPENQLNFSNIRRLPIEEALYRILVRLTSKTFLNKDDIEYMFFIAKICGKIFKDFNNENELIYDLNSEFDSLVIDFNTIRKNTYDFLSIFSSDSKYELLSDISCLRYRIDSNTTEI